MNKDRRDLAGLLRESDSNNDMELAESLRPALKRARASVRLLYEADEVWNAAVEAVAVVDGPTRRLVELVPNYRVSLPALLELFGYLVPPPPTAEEAVERAVLSLQAVPDNAGREERINAVYEARGALGELLERMIPLETARPWELPIIASQTIPALDMGIQVLTAAGTGAVGAALGAAVGAVTAATAGIAAVPFLVLGGVYGFLRKKRMRERDEQLLEAREELSLDLVPAARGAVLQHLDAIVSLARCAAESPQARLDLIDHLDVLLDITRLFGVSNSHLRVKAVQQAQIPGGSFNLQVLMQMPGVSAAARRAKASLDLGGQIDEQTHAELEGLLNAMMIG